MFAIYLLGIVLGYLLLAIATTYVVVKQAGKRGATKCGKVIATFITLFIFWLIPFWDWIPTVIYHNHLCKTEAGVKIYRSVEGVEGFDGGSRWALSIGYLYGYSTDHLGGFFRFRKNINPPSDKPWNTEIQEPAPKPPLYGVKLEQLKLGKWNAWKLTQTIYVIRTGEVLATFTDFVPTAADPNVPMSEWRKPWLSGYSCFHKDGGSDSAIRTEMLKDMLLKTLKPLQAKN